MGEFDEFHKARNLIVDVLQKDIVGPVFEDEMLDELPAHYYASGILFPRAGEGYRGAVDSVEDGSESGESGETEEDGKDEFVSAAHLTTQSSAGITFAVGAGSSTVKIVAAYAFYQAVAGQGEPRTHPCWQRKGHVVERSVPLKDGGRTSRYFDLEGGIRLHLVVRSVLEDGSRMLTAALENRHKATGEMREDSALTAFQVSLRVESPTGKSCFVPVVRNIAFGKDEEIARMDMLYAHARTWAQGHGCSACWDEEHAEPLWVGSTFLPLCKTRQMKSPVYDGLKNIFNMRTLATGNRKNIVAGLKEIATAYKEWIDKLEQKRKQFAQQAEKNAQGCLKAYERIKRGIACLENDEVVFHAFQLANEAMAMQQEQAAVKNDDKPVNPEWRLFQLGFFLHEISSFALPESPEREVVDLLWFPTGGGKTEAYLGLAAFVIFLRRLRDPKDDGTTVLMRYTLRLLTFQQFQRACMLIFACDLLRQREFPEWAEISTGFWAGMNLTPNTLAKAQSFPGKGNKEEPGEEGSPCLLEECPWCGHILGQENYEVDGKAQKLRIRCGNGECAFSKKDFPVHIIDESLYAHLPTFVLATVDKFAQLPLQEKAGRILCAHTGKNPPELIIQDELHLLAGPLGTMTGIYEAAIQKICKKDGIPAKIIASTATIRNAADQILSLYGREHTQFPPPGITMRDSFFALDASEDELPTRLYVGVLGERLTTKTMLIRVLADILFASRHLAVAGFSDEVVDNYWTLVAYFNSLRELGGANIAIFDDIHGRFSYLARKKFAALYPGVDPDKKYENLLELTSRQKSMDLPAAIKRLEREWKKNNQKDVYDFVLASNMMSVGVDVGRLGIMTILGQPKTSAEYIQASSRTGRRNPGLVITVYNPQRSRDLSHFEQFLRFHSSLYRYVEASSLTPFSDRARDRALQALFVTLCRCLVPELASDRGAAAFKPGSSQIGEIVDYIKNYVAGVDGAELAATAQELEQMVEKWHNSIRGKDFRYRYNPRASGCLIKNELANDRFSMMNSLRSVEGKSTVFIQGEEK